jgi:hypothetical protein
VFGPEIGVAAAIGTVLETRAPKPLVPAAVVAAALLAPFAIVAGGDMTSQVLGFAGIQDLQRLPLVPSLDVGLDANKLLGAPRAAGARRALAVRPRAGRRPAAERAPAPSEPDAATT